MKKSILILALCFVLMFAVAVVSAQDTEAPAEEPVAEEPVAEEPAGFKVTYLENNCLAEVPTDEKAYAAGEEVTVLFEPVKYKDYLVFYGWDWDDDGVADYGYYYDKFNMPEKDVELKAICIAPVWGAAPCQGCHLGGKAPAAGLSTIAYFPYEVPAPEGTGD